MAAVPMGMRFRPTDEEKINFLLCKVTGQPLPCGEIIGTADLYGEKEPWEILGDWDELCFFTMLKKIGKIRFSRNVGNGGTWSNKGKKGPIYGEKILPRGGVIGYKRCFRYEAAKNDQDGTWLLKEYTLPDFKAGKVKEEYKDYALCVLKRKGCGKTPPAHDHVGGLMDNNYFMSLLSASGSETQNHQQESNYYHAPPAAAACDLLLGSGSGSGSETQNHQEESNYYHAPAAAACDLRLIAQQFIREEQSTNIPSLHTQHHYGNLFSQAQDAMINMSSSYY